MLIIGTLRYLLQQLRIRTIYNNILYTMLQENDSGSTRDKLHKDPLLHISARISALDGIGSKVNTMMFNPALWSGLKPAMRGASRRQVPTQSPLYAR